MSHIKYLPFKKPVVNPPIPDDDSISMGSNISDELE